MRSKDRKEHYLKLTLAVYRVADLFPEEEILGRQIRTSADKILADLIYNQLEFTEGVGIIEYPLFLEKQRFESEAICTEIKDLENFLEQAQKINLADSRNFAVLIREYRKIWEYIHNCQNSYSQPDLFNAGRPLADRPQTQEQAKEKGNGYRKEKILETIKNKDNVKVGELVQVFPRVSRRTLIRDLEELYKNGSIIRIGSGRGANYSIRL